MARRPRSAKLETRTNRLKLPVAKKPHAFTEIGVGIALGYRRCQGPGRWVVRCADGHGGNWIKVVGIADDHEDADGEHVLDFWQAQDKARVLARGTEESGAPITVDQALTAYAADLAARGGQPGNVSRVRHHLPPALADKAVALLSSRELQRFRDALATRIAAASVNRTLHALRAAFNLAHRHDPTRVVNAHAWKIGLRVLPDAHRSRNVILTDDQVRALIAAAYAGDPAFGLLTETAAVTGARPSQIVRLEVGDLLLDRADGPALWMPRSGKGHSRKRRERHPIPIPASLATALRRAAAGRETTAPLLLRANGKPWSASSADHRLPFARAVGHVGLNPRKVTFYSLRHSCAVRQILAGAPLRVIAAALDTSTTQLEKTYSRFIAEHSDVVLRRGLLDAAQPSTGNVVALPGGRRP
jgi:integrase